MARRGAAPGSTVLDLFKDSENCVWKSLEHPTLLSSIPELADLECISVENMFQNAIDPAMRGLPNHSRCHIQPPFRNISKAHQSISFSLQTSSVRCLDLSQSTGPPPVHREKRLKISSFRVSLSSVLSCLLGLGRWSSGGVATRRSRRGWTVVGRWDGVKAAKRRRWTDWKTYRGSLEMGVLYD